MKKIGGVVIGIVIIAVSFLWVGAQSTGEVCDINGNCSISPSKLTTKYANFSKKTEVPVLEFKKFTHDMYEEDVKNGKKRFYFIAFVREDGTCPYCEDAQREGQLLDQLNQYYKDDPLVGVYVAYPNDNPMTDNTYIYSQYVQEHPDSCMAKGSTPVFAWATANGVKWMVKFGEIACGYDRKVLAQAKDDVIRIIEAMKMISFPSENSNDTQQTH